MEILRRGNVEYVIILVLDVLIRGYVWNVILHIWL